MRLAKLVLVAGCYSVIGSAPGGVRRPYRAIESHTAALRDLTSQSGIRVFVFAGATRDALASAESSPSELEPRDVDIGVEGLGETALRESDRFGDADP